MDPGVELLTDTIHPTNRLTENVGTALGVLHPNLSGEVGQNVETGADPLGVGDQHPSLFADNLFLDPCLSFARRDRISVQDGSLDAQMLLNQAADSLQQIGVPA